MFEFNATLIVAMISFVVFMFIMNAIFYRPISVIINKRDLYIEDNYNEAKRTDQTTQEYNDEYDEKITNAKEENRKKVSQELDSVQKKFFEETNTAKTEAKKQIQAEKDKLLEQKETLINDIRNNVVCNISDLITSKIIK